MITGKPKGFRNIGNSDFLSATVHCLASLRPFHKFWLKSIPKECKQNKEDKNTVIFIVLRSCLMEYFDMNKQGPIIPSHLNKYMHHINPAYVPNKPQDCHKFVCDLLNTIEGFVANSLKIASFKKVFNGVLQNTIVKLGSEADQVKKESFLTISLVRGS